MTRLQLKLIAAALFAITLPLRAQQTPQPTLDEVLTRVAANFHTYVTSIPNIYAEEQLTTNMDNKLGIGGANSSRGAAADSIYSLRHETSPDGKPRLVESRELKSIDHKPVAADAKLQTPVMEVDIFSYGASFLSPALAVCYDYKLKINQHLQKRPALIVEYTAKRFMKRSACPVFEPHSGRAFIDPDTMQVLRMEQTRPEHPVGDILKATPFHSQFEDDATGTWTWAVDYAPVELDGKTFWLPKTISATTTTNHTPTVHWSFLATYRNYHLLTVKSKVLPGYTVQK